GLGMRVELDGSYWLDGTLMSAESKPDFAQDEAQMGRVFEALDRVTPDGWAAYCDGTGVHFGLMRETETVASTVQAAAFDLVLAVTGYEDGS
ncbi:MAG: hypothetical protein GY722_15415, partial [bacterium]|nr:hypothetical protein [bacterium]